MNPTGRRNLTTQSLLQQDREAELRNGDWNSEWNRGMHSMQILRLREGYPCEAAAMDSSEAGSVGRRKFIQTSSQRHPSAATTAFFYLLCCLPLLLCFSASLLLSPPCSKICKPLLAQLSYNSSHALQSLFSDSKIKP